MHWMSRTNEQTYRETYRSMFQGLLGLTYRGLVGLMPSGALYPSKSGLINKHTVKHTVMSVIEIIHKQTEIHRAGIVKHIAS
jgi:hypothetical protein